MSTNEQIAPRPSSFDQIKSWLLTPWALIVAIPLLVWVLDPGEFSNIMNAAVGSFFGTLPYILFAVLLIAWLKAAGVEAMIANAFKGREVRMIFLAAAFGGLAPFCSCEVIPFIAGLLALGAPLSAVMAFWLSSPLIDPPTLLITASALGWPFAVGKAVSAVALGLFGGFAIKTMMSAGLFKEPLKEVSGSGCGCGPSPFSGKPQWAVWKDMDRRQTFKSEFISNALFLIKWLALAYVLQGVLITYVPAELIASAVGGEGIGSIAIAAIVGMPAYLNSYVAPPLLAGLMEQGMGSGAAMAFMITGAISCIPAMAAVWSLVKTQVFFSYVGLGIAGAIISGIIFQMII